MSSKQKLFKVQCDDVCSVHGGGVRGGVHDDDISTGPGSFLPGTMTADGGSSSSLSSF